MEEKLVLKAAVRAVAAEARCAIDDHPMPDELVDYHAGDLTAAEQERIQDHLALCPDCARAVLEMDALPDPGSLAPAERLGDRELAAEWERFRERTGPIRLSRRNGWLKGPSLRYGLAAVMALAVLGLAFQLGRRSGSSPPSSLQTVELFSVDDVVRGEEDDAVRVEPWATDLLLLLAPPDGAGAGEHEVAVFAADGREVWRRSAVHASADGSFAVAVPRELVPAGAYRVRLYCPAPGRQQQGEYSLIVRR